MNSRLLLACSLMALGPAGATLVVTEVNSNGTPTDFWELTNFGAASVNLSGFKWIDDAASPTSPAALTIPSGTVIAPNESIVFVTSGTEAEFRSAWNLAAGVQVILGGPNLGQNDAVYLFNAFSTQVASLNYAAGGFVRSTGAGALGGHAGASAGGAANQSLIYDPNYGSATRRYTFASGANFETYAAASPNSGVGSPGRIGVAGSNSLPVFTNAVRAYWRVGTSLAGSSFRVVAVDTDPGQAVTVSVVSKPAWLTLTADGAGRLRLGGTPSSAGDFEFTVRATDNAPIPGVTEETFVLTAFATSSPIILNEYNGVSPTEFLRGGTASADVDGVSPGPVDTHFGRVLGNGGEWVEFAVVGNGSPGSTTDLRGWTIEVLGNTGTRVLKLSQDAYWANVISGTLLTFTGADSANGGLDTGVHRVGALHNLGYVWTNVWAGDAVLISQGDSIFDGSLGIDADDTRFVVRNAAGVAIYGPAGEGVATADPAIATALLGLNSREVMRLQQNPNPGVDPLFGTYNDADSSSSFGAPNSWGNGPTVQSFSGYVRPNSPPRFTSTPVTRAYGSYSYAVTTTDPNGNAVSLSAPGLPGFLSFTQGAGGSGVLASNRALSLADAGQYVIRLVASDGGAVAATTPQSFVLTVFNDGPSVVLNEHNAVSAGNFLNGGVAGADSDGGAVSVDAHFGRVAGNGGRWVELVVVGAGGVSEVDLRGWTLEVGSSLGGEFRAVNRLKLSQNPYWAAVPTGTILTFIDRTTASGGLDSGVNLRDRLTSEGDAWTNVWMGDAALLDYTSAAVNGYAVSGGSVDGIRIDNNDTQFVLKNAAGQAVFGPVGEGIAPLSGVSSTEIFELEADPRPGISPLQVATVEGTGYDDGASGSTFGWPNRWQAGGGGAEVSQDFGVFVRSASPYDAWALSFGLGGAGAEVGADPDDDGRANFEEYVFGGNPSLADVSPVAQTISRNAGAVSWSYLRRVGDPGVGFVHETSENLVAWDVLAPGELTVTVAPHPSLAGYEVATVEMVEAAEGRRFYRVRGSRE